MTHMGYHIRHASDTLTNEADVLHLRITTVYEYCNWNLYTHNYKTKRSRIY